MAILRGIRFRGIRFLLACLLPDMGWCRVAWWVIIWIISNFSHRISPRRRRKRKRRRCSIIIMFLVLACLRRRLLLLLLLVPLQSLRVLLRLLLILRRSVRVLALSMDLRLLPCADLDWRWEGERGGGWFLLLCIADVITTTSKAIPPENRTTHLPLNSSTPPNLPPLAPLPNPPLPRHTIPSLFPPSKAASTRVLQ